MKLELLLAILSIVFFQTIGFRSWRVPFHRQYLRNFAQKSDKMFIGPEFSKISPSGKLGGGELPFQDMPNPYLDPEYRVPLITDNRSVILPEGFSQEEYADWKGFLRSIEGEEKHPRDIKMVTFDVENRRFVGKSLSEISPNRIVKYYNLSMLEEKYQQLLDEKKIIPPPYSTSSLDLDLLFPFLQEDDTDIDFSQIVPIVERQPQTIYTTKEELKAIWKRHNGDKLDEEYNEEEALVLVGNRDEREELDDYLKNSVHYLTFGVPPPSYLPSPPKGMEVEKQPEIKVKEGNEGVVVAPEDIDHGGTENVVSLAEVTVSEQVKHRNNSELYFSNLIISFFRLPQELRRIWDARAPVFYKDNPEMARNFTVKNALLLMEAVQQEEEWDFGDEEYFEANILPEINDHGVILCFFFSMSFFLLFYFLFLFQ
jgi:hypothetical protein